MLEFLCLARMLSKINATSYFPFEGSPVIISNLIGVGTNPTEVDVVGRINRVNNARCWW